VARISFDGTATVANAGHLSPYLNGNEMEISAGLPLGIAPDAAYEESPFTINPGVPITFVSDGIVEARNASGELFGFDRMLQISNHSAEAIAQAAISFGQDDDITVLTITRVAVQDHASAQALVPAILPSTA
jgi:serine phosphatase RsbU (regulator of sigma subunit)